MHFLKRIIAASIMLMAVLSGQGWYAAIATTCVDFPNDSANPALKTPGHSGIVTATDDVNFRFPFKVIEFAENGDEFTWIQVPNANNANIYFPVDGRQPTTPEAATWACANIDNTLTSPITEWYMQMFGWTPTGGVTLQIGFAPLAAGVARPAPQNPKEIITLDNSMDAQNTDIPNPAGGENFNRREAFWHTFRQIAANPVGRVLLYRLLIEIRRQHGGNGCDKREGQIERQIRARNNARSLTLKYCPEDDWGYDEADDHSNGKIYCYFEEDRLPIPLAAGAQNALCTVDALENIQIYASTCLFHEMLHWYQELRDYDRVQAESEKQLLTITNADLPAIYAYHNVAIPYLSWWVEEDDEDDDHDKVEVDELRIICGAIKSEGYPYLEGDDLSENAFRCSINAKMYFGHGNSIPNSQLVVQEAMINAHNNALNCVQSIIPNNNRLAWPLNRLGALQ